jgi:hypothetical protein
MQAQRLLFFILSLLFYNSALAGTVVKSSGKKVYIVFDQSEGGTFAKDDLFTITNANGKKIGVVEIKKVKGLKAIGVLVKGRATKGNGTVFRSISKKGKKTGPLESLKNSKPARLDTDDEYDAPVDAMRTGLQLGLGMAKQDVQQDGGTASQSGQSIGIKGLLDYPLFSSISLYTALGVELFSVSGTGANATTGETNVGIETKITFLSLDALMRWNMNSGPTKFYLLGGGGILHPLSKSSDSINPSTITSLAVGEVGAGVEFKLGGFTLPVDVVYYYFPPGDTVTTSLISFKVGVFF